MIDVRYFFGIMLLVLSSSSSAAAQECDCNGREGSRWTNRVTSSPTKGGCVSSGSFVGESVFIAPSAKVCGDNVIAGEQIRIIGDALVDGTAEISGKSILIGRGAHVGGTAVIGSNTKLVEISVRYGKKEGVSLNGTEIAHENARRAKRSAARSALREAIRGLQKEVEALSHKHVGVADYEFSFPSLCEVQVAVEGNDHYVAARSERSVDLSSAEFERSAYQKDKREGIFFLMMFAREDVRLRCFNRYGRRLADACDNKGKKMLFHVRSKKQMNEKVAPLLKGLQRKCSQL